MAQRCYAELECESWYSTLCVVRNHTESKHDKHPKPNTLLSPLQKGGLAQDGCIQAAAFAEATQVRKRGSLASSFEVSSVHAIRFESV